MIARISSTRKTTRTITLDAPVSGYVSAKEVFEGMQIEAGTTIFTVEGSPNRDTLMGLVKVMLPRL